MNSSASEAPGQTVSEGAQETVRITGRVLVVEPDSEVRRSIRRTLQNAGAVVDVASTERDAVECCALHDYAVVVTATELPGSTAFGLIREFQRQNTRALFVLVSASPHFEAEQTRTCDDLIMGILHRPLDFGELVQVVQGAAVIAASRRPSGERLGFHALRGPILVVHDDASTVARVRAVVECEPQPPELLVCSRLKDALERLRERRFSSAVVDLVVPDARGLDVVRKLHAADPGLAIVVLSGEIEDVAEQGLAVGAHEVIDDDALAT